LTTLRTQVQATLAADGTLAAILTGGVYDRRGINRTATPAAYDSRGQLKPSAVVVESTQEEISTHPDAAGFVRHWFQVYYYEAEGGNYANIDAAKARTRALLHGQKIAVTDGVIHQIRFADGGPDWYDDALLAEASYDRFFAWRRR